MAPRSDFVDFLLEGLQPLGAVSARRMFGGYGIYCEGVMFGLVADDALYLKVDATNRPVTQRGKTSIVPVIRHQVLGVIGQMFVYCRRINGRPARRRRRFSVELHVKPKPIRVTSVRASFVPGKSVHQDHIALLQLQRVGIGH